MRRPSRRALTTLTTLAATAASGTAGVLAVRRRRTSTTAADPAPPPDREATMSKKTDDETTRPTMDEPRTASHPKLEGAQAAAARDKDSTPHPDAPEKPTSPTDLTKPSWIYVLRKTVREFMDDQCTDLAAALTYYAVLALFPAMIALISVLGVLDQGPKAVDAILDIARRLVDGSTVDLLAGPLETMASSQAAGLGLVLGLAGALFSASGYVGAFGRAMNRIYEILEGRPFYKLRPIMIFVTLIAVMLTAVALLILVISGPVAGAIGRTLGLESVTVLVWSIAKWPLLALIVVMVVAILYYATPNVQQPKFRWMSVGALFAIVVWVLASVAFAFYVGNFSSYSSTYGTMAGFVVFLLWLWITNLALLFGAELDAELERGRQLQAGIEAEVTLQLPARDTKGIEKIEERVAKDIERGREIREQAVVAEHENGSDGTNRTEDTDGSSTRDEGAATGLR